MALVGTRLCPGPSGVPRRTLKLESVGEEVTPDLRLSCPRRGWRREEQLYTCTAAAAAEARLWSEAELHTREGPESCRETEEA